MTAVTWTLAYRKPRANRFQRVTNWAGTWNQARELCGIWSEAHPELEVWYVPSAASDAAERTFPEDRGNILTNTGRRVRITETGELPEWALARVPDADEAAARFSAGAY